ncbi:unnamed protein product, partial [Urochloa humidicola]
AAGRHLPCVSFSNNGYGIEISGKRRHRPKTTVSPDLHQGPAFREEAEGTKK